MLIGYDKFSVINDQSWKKHHLIGDENQIIIHCCSNILMVKPIQPVDEKE